MKVILLWKDENIGKMKTECEGFMIENTQTAQSGDEGKRISDL